MIGVIVLPAPIMAPIIITPIIVAVSVVGGRSVGVCIIGP